MSCKWRTVKEEEWEEERAVMGHRSEVRGFYHCAMTPSDPSVLPLVLKREKQEAKLFEIICTEEEVKEQEVQEGEVIT